MIVLLPVSVNKSVLTPLEAILVNVTLGILCLMLHTVMTLMNVLMQQYVPLLVIRFVLILTVRMNVIARKDIARIQLVHVWVRF